MKKKVFSLLLASAVSMTSISAIANTALTKEDNEALSWVIQLDKNEITASKETLKKSKDAQVRGFANLMIKQHGANLKDTLSMNPKLSKKPVETKDTEMLKEHGQELMKTLSSLKGKEYDAAYMQAMVKGHTSALETLDNDFLNKVQTEKVKTHLEETRTHINHHLQEATLINEKMPA